MKEILSNLANIDLINFCKANNIDCSDSYIYKNPNKQQYYLLHNKNQRTIATVTFHKHQIPTHSINPDFKL